MSKLSPLQEYKRHLAAFSVEMQTRKNRPLKEAKPKKSTLRPVSEKRQTEGQPAKEKAYRAAKRRDGKLCQYCAVLYGRKEPATECDHVVKQSQSKLLAADPDNLISACHTCNFTRRENGEVTAALQKGKEESKQVIAGNGKKAVREVMGSHATEWRITGP